MKKKFKILTKFKTAQPLMQADKIVFYFEYHDGRILEKSNCTVLDSENGLVEVEITDFELQGLKAGENQNCKCKIFMQNMDVLDVLFSKAYSINIVDGRKVWL